MTTKTTKLELVQINTRLAAELEAARAKNSELSAVLRNTQLELAEARSAVNDVKEMVTAEFRGHYGPQIALTKRQEEAARRRSSMDAAKALAISSGRMTKFCAATH